MWIQIHSLFSYEVSCHAHLTMNAKGKAIARPIKEHTDKHCANQRRLKIKSIEKATLIWVFNDAA